MTFGLRCGSPACRPHPASLPVRVPTVEGLLHAAFSFTSRLRLAFHYGCRHRLRLAPFIQQDSAHAGHTGAGGFACAGPLVRPMPGQGSALRLVSSTKRSPPRAHDRKVTKSHQAAMASDLRSQKSWKRPLNRQQRKAMMALEPLTVQCMPERLRRVPMASLHPASTTPVEVHKPCS